MRLSESDLRALLARVSQVAATHDPEAIQATVLAFLLFLERQETAAFVDSGLTKREGELLVRAMRGETNAEIGEALSISERTVAKHLQHAYAKLGVHGRREAARLVAAGSD